MPGCEHAYVASSAQTVGVRESRHILGEYVLTGADALAGRKFADAIARCAYGVDIHDPQGANTSMQAIGGDGSFDIPYRCLVPQAIGNLLVAGRAISGDHVAHAAYHARPDDPHDVKPFPTRLPFAVHDIYLPSLEPA